MERRLVKPAAGKLVRDPDHGLSPLPPEGRVIDFPLSTYWYRRLEDGDITVDAAPAERPLAPAAKPAENAATDKKLQTRVERGAAD